MEHEWSPESVTDTQPQLPSVSATLRVPRTPDMSVAWGHSQLQSLGPSSSSDHGTGPEENNEGVFQPQEDPLPTTTEGL